MSNNGITLGEFLDTDKKVAKTAPPRNVEIVKSGKQIIIPEGITYDQALKLITAKRDQDERELARQEMFHCHPNDGLVNFTRLLRETFGWIDALPQPGFFGPRPPAMTSVPISATETEKVFASGDITVPGLPDVKFRVGGDVEEMSFYVVVNAKYKHQHALTALFEELGRRIEEHSIYKGKCIDSNFEFKDFGQTRPQDIILNRSVKELVEANVWTPIIQRPLLAELGIPFKRGTLLEGPYGGGKTLISHATGHIAQDNGVTFLYIKPEHFGSLSMFLQYARRYQPCVIFYEDIDQVIDKDDRNHKVNAILNELDGIESKQRNDIMVILTTNHVEDLEPALLRPGRLDAVIHVGLPDAETALRLVRHYGGDLLEEFTAEQELLVAQACEGMPAAFIREVVERSKLVAISRRPGAAPRLSAHDLVLNGEAMQRHLELASPDTSVRSLAERHAATSQDLVREVVDVKFAKLFARFGIDQDDEE